MSARPHRPWALSVVVSESFLNGLARTGIGDGVAVAPLRSSFQLPMMGPMDMTLGLTITEVSFRMAADHGNRLHATIRAAGHAEVHGETPMPLLPGLARVRGEVLVEPVIELFGDDRFVAQLDVSRSELLDVVLEDIEGVEGDAEAQRQLSEMLFATVGGELFGGLAQRMGPVGLELPPERGVALRDLGVAPGPADLRIGDGSMTVGLPSVDGLEGSARPVEVRGHRLGVGVASGALAVLADQLARERYGMGLPFDLDVGTREDRLEGRVRNPRLVTGEALPDLRPGLRTSIVPRLVDGRVELALRAAWLELPDVAPGITGRLNRLNRWIGGVASRSPWSVGFPARVSLPARPGSTATLRAAISDIDVGPDGVHVLVDAQL